jgi:zeaxanthin glucosyltransferase
MMKIGFLAPAAPGHILTMTTLARKMQERGHEVVCIGVLDAAPMIQAADLPFISYGEQEYPVGSYRAQLAELGKLNGQEALAFTLQLLTKSSQVLLTRLPETLQASGVEALVIDAVLIDVALVPMHLGMPYVHVCSALTLDFSGNTPPCIFPWSYNPTPEGLARNQEGLRQFAQMMEAPKAVARKFAEQVGLDIDWSDPLATVSKLAWLTQTPQVFDFPGSHWPAQYHHTGPFHDGQGRVPADFPWERLTGEPLIYASMGTLQNGHEAVFSTIAEAVGERPGMQLVMSIGPTLQASQIQSVPANAIIVNYAPQIELLKRSALCITHAGQNTALESLMQGVPMVAIPVTNDQPGVAARIVYSRTGASVPLQQLTAKGLSALIDEVLGNPEYRENAMRMKEAIGGTAGLEKAANLVEHAFGLSFKAPQLQEAPVVS